jgi:hypothetical protein
MRIPDMAKRMVCFRGFVVSAALEELGSGTGRAFVFLRFFFDM